MWLRSVEIENPFTEYHYIDIDKEKAKVLSRLTHDIPNIKIYEGDSNEILRKDILPLLTYETRKRALCIF